MQGDIKSVDKVKIQYYTIRFYFVDKWIHRVKKLRTKLLITSVSNAIKFYVEIHGFCFSRGKLKFENEEKY